MKSIFNWVPSRVCIAIISVITGFLAGALLILSTGENPFTGFGFLFRGGFMNLERIGNTIATATPLIFTGLSVAFAFQTGLFNIGASGQLLLGGLGATIVGVGLNLTMPKPMFLTFMLLAAIFCGAIWGMIPGLLKSFFNVHEVVCTIMMNWLAYWLVYFTVPAYLSNGFIMTESQKISEDASLRVDWLTNFFNGSYINLGFVIAILTLVIIWVILEKTVLGFELKAVGLNRDASKFHGMNLKRHIVVSMTISGALAGVGGMALYAGYALNLQIGVLPSQGFDGIAVSLLGANSPVGVIFSALFLGALHSGKGFMNAMTDIPQQIGDTIIAIIIYFSAASVLVDRIIGRVMQKRRPREAGTDEGLN